nr:Unknown Function [uncultured bacterium]
MALLNFITAILSLSGAPAVFASTSASSYVYCELHSNGVEGPEVEVGELNLLSPKPLAYERLDGSTMELHGKLNSDNLSVKLTIRLLDYRSLEILRFAASVRRLNGDVAPGFFEAQINTAGPSTMVVCWVY